MTLVTLCNLMLSLLLCWTESSITWLPRDSCLSGTKSKDSNAPLPTPAANPPSSTIFGHTPCRTAHEIHNQKPTHHHTATNFRAWDPMPKIKSQIQIHRKWIQNQNAYSDWPIKDPQTQIPNFWLTHSDHKHKSQPIYHQDLPWKREREIERRDESYQLALIMDATFSSWSWPYQFWITTKKHQIVSERERLKPRICETYFEFWLGRGAFRSFDLVLLKQESRVSHVIELSIQHNIKLKRWGAKSNKCHSLLCKTCIRKV